MVEATFVFICANHANAATMHHTRRAMSCACCAVHKAHAVTTLCAGAAQDASTKSTRATRAVRSPRQAHATTNNKALLATG